MDERVLHRRKPPAPEPMEFHEMLGGLLLDGVFTQSDMAKNLGISSQYFSDLIHGRKAPSVRLVNRVCEYMGRKAMGRREWHAAGARAHGWEV